MPLQKAAIRKLILSNPQPLALLKSPRHMTKTRTERKIQTSKQSHASPETISDIPICVLNGRPQTPQLVVHGGHRWRHGSAA
jgi:hypothetical protein